MTRLSLPRLLVAVALAWAAGGEPAWAAEDDATQPKRHFKIEQSKQLTGAEALTVYDQIADELAAGYALEAEPAAGAYRAWRRHNATPYRSATHGSRYVNNYGSAEAVGYGGGGPMPPGAILAKDSSTAASDGSVFGAALFLMEKLAAGASAATADWRYVMIMPDGSLFGDSAGADADKVAFCHTCHVAVANRDHLFYVPKKHRRRALKPATSK